MIDTQRAVRALFREFGKVRTRELIALCHIQGLESLCEDPEVAKYRQELEVCSRGVEPWWVRYCGLQQRPSNGEHFLYTFETMVNKSPLDELLLNLYYLLIKLDIFDIDTKDKLMAVCDHLDMGKSYSEAAAAVSRG